MWGHTMNFRTLAAIAAVCVTAAGTAGASTIYNFKAAADGAYGESAYDTFSMGGIDFTATQNLDGGNEEAAKVYLDARNAGMGVCGYANTLGPRPNQTSNVCLNSTGGQLGSDDSIQHYKNETLALVASAGDVVLDAIWVNFNHDLSTGTAGGWEWLIDGVSYTLANGGVVADTSFPGTGDYKIDLGGLLITSKVVEIVMVGGPHSYISGMSVSTVPVPAAGLLLLGGLGGLAALKRRKKA